MTIRSLTRWLVAPLACWLVIAPTIAGLAHERAHHAMAGHSGRLPGDHEHDSDHDHGFPKSGSEHSASGDHADSGHHATRIGSGLSARADLAVAEEPPTGTFRALVVARLRLALVPLHRQSDQTHHPPSLPRAPPRV